MFPAARVCRSPGASALTAPLNRPALGIERAQRALSQHAEGAPSRTLLYLQAAPHLPDVHYSGNVPLAEVYNPASVYKKQICAALGWGKNISAPFQKRGNLLAFVSFVPLTFSLTLLRKLRFIPLHAHLTSSRPPLSGRT